MTTNRSLYGTTDFVGDYIEVNQVSITGNNPSIAIGLTTIQDQEVSVSRTMGIPNSGEDGQFVITNGDVDQIIGGNNTFTGMNTFDQTTTFKTNIKVDTINEYTLNNGVDIDGVTVKDFGVTCSQVSANTGNLTDIYCDTIHEKSSVIGLNVANDLHCQGEIYIEPLGATPGPLKVLTGSGLVYPDLITNADIVPAAGIPYSKLSLGNSVQGSDIKTTTNITCNDLTTTNNLQCDGIFTANDISTDINTANQLYVNTAAQMVFMGSGVVKSNVSGNLSSSSIVNTDVSASAAIAYSKLALSNSIVNGDINSAAAIAYSKLNLANSVTNADLAGSIADTKLLTISTAGKVSNSATTATDANTASAIVARDASGNFSCGTITSSGNISASSGFVRANEGVAFGLQWANSGLGNLSSIYSTNRNTFIFQMNGLTLYTFTNTGLTTSPYTTAGVLKSTVTTGAITTATIVNADVSASAGITDNKLATISTAGKVSNSATTATSANTNNAIVARDGSGNFAASQGRFTSLSLDGGTNSISGILQQAAWTPTVTDAAGNQCTYLSRAATFSRIGNRVWVNAYIQINAKTGLTAGDTIRIGGLPYTIGSFGNVGNWNYGATSYTPPANTIGLYCEAINGTTYMNVGWQIITGARGAFVSELNATGYFSLSCAYSV